MFQNQLAKSDDDLNFTRADLPSGRVLGIATIHQETDETSTRMMTVVELSAAIRAKVFAAFLQFLYTGPFRCHSSLLCNSVERHK